jgi:hypothetical protein
MFIILRQDFYDLRLELYSERKECIVNELEQKYKKISNKVDAQIVHCIDIAAIVNSSEKNRFVSFWP